MRQGKISKHNSMRYYGSAYLLVNMSERHGIFKLKWSRSGNETARSLLSIHSLNFLAVLIVMLDGCNLYDMVSCVPKLYGVKQRCR